jgi:putative aldouronate transport system substrate-binding protein
MKMKKGLKTIISICLVLALLAIVGCNVQTTAKKEEPQMKEETSSDKLDNFGKKDTWLADKKITLNVMCVDTPPTVAAKSIAVPYEELTIWTELEKLTNIKLEFTKIPSSSWAEKKNLAFASGDLPDLFMAGGLAMDEIDTYGPQGFLVPLDQYINEKIAPYIVQAFDEYPLLKKMARSPDGKTYALPGYNRTATTGGEYSLYVNFSWLTELGMEKPKTIDDFYYVLKEFKKKDPAGQGNTIPLCVQGIGGPNAIMTAFGEHPNFISMRSNKVVSFMASENYKEYLKYMNQLYLEELIDENFISQSLDEFNAKVLSGYAGVSTGSSSYPNFENFPILEPLTSKYNKEPMTVGEPGSYSIGRFAITKLNKYPIESVKLGDIFFRHHDEHLEGYCGDTMWLGRVGYEWELVEKDGVSYIRELFERIEGYDGIAIRTALHTRGQRMGILDIEALFEEGAYLEWLGRQFIEHLRPFQTVSHQFPAGVRFNPEELTRASILRTDLESYVNQMKAKFMTGEEPLDNWDAYVKQLESMGMEEYLKIQQAAYDAFTK